VRRSNAEPHIVAIVKQNMAAVDKAIGDQSSVASDQPIGEQKWCSIIIESQG
jgi:hypothetical protein